MPTRSPSTAKTIGENVRDAMVQDPDVIRPYKQPLKEKAGFKVLKGNLFDSAIMKISVISQEFCQRYLSNPKDPNAFEAWESLQVNGAV